MAYPAKQQELYLRLKAELAAAVNRPGGRLPTERYWAKELGVTRRTLRFVLDKLEREGEIARLKARGTFVGGGPARGKAPQVNVLLPCAEYLTASGAYAFLHRMLIQGAMRGAVEAGAQLVTLPVSRRNSPDAPDWDVLGALNSESRVVMLGCWYKTLFPFLRERGCKVAILAGVRPWRDAVGDDPPPGWRVTFWDPVAAARQLGSFLFSQGCRKLGAVWSVGSFEAEGVAGFQQACAAAGAPFEPGNFVQESGDFALGGDVDGLLLECSPGAARRVLAGLAAHVKLLAAVPLLAALNPPPGRAWGYSLAADEAARDMVRELFGMESACGRVATYQIAPVSGHDRQGGPLMDAW